MEMLFSMKGSSTYNEEGCITCGFNFKPNRKNKMVVYYDYFTFPWLRFGYMLILQI